MLVDDEIGTYFQNRIGCQVLQQMIQARILGHLVEPTQVVGFVFVRTIPLGDFPLLIPEFYLLLNFVGRIGWIENLETFGWLHHHPMQIVEVPVVQLLQLVSVGRGNLAS